MSDENVVDINKRRHEQLMAAIREHHLDVRKHMEMTAAFHRSLSTKLDRLNKRMEDLQQEMLDVLKEVSA